MENFTAPAPTGVHLDPAERHGHVEQRQRDERHYADVFHPDRRLEFVDENGSGMVDVDEIRVLTAAEAAAGLTAGSRSR